MDGQQFLAEFAHIANAPGGIAHLRQMIYQLAITGSLTPRGDSGEDAGVLLTRIAEQRRRLIHAKQYKRMLELESEPVRPPRGIVLPATWRWTRLLDIGEINPRNDAPDDQLAAFVPMSGVPQPHRASIVAETKRWDEIKKGYTHFANGDVVLAKITPCFENGKAAVVEGLPGDAGIGAGTTELQVFRPIHAGVVSAYVYLFLRSPLFTVEGEQNMTGTAGQKRVPTDYFATRAFPLPPSEEQSRIVAKVDELMALCDQLEQQQQDRRKLQNALRQSTLQALVSARSPHELRSSWQRLHANFGRMATGPADVDAFRQTVLQLAVRGRLELQVRQDEPAQVLLKRIAAERVLLVKAGKASKPKSLPPMTESEVPFHVPDGWCWARFADVANIASNLVQPQAHPTAPHVAPDCIEKGSGRLLGYRTVAEDGVRSSKHLFYPGQILYSKIRPNLSKVITVDFGGLCSADMYPIDAWIDCRYLHCYMLSSSFLVQVVSEDNRLAMPKVNQDQLSAVLVPVPPLEEQRRIVRKVDLLMQICERLEKQLDEAANMAGRLAISTISALTGITIEQDEDIAVKAPQTELIAPLRLATPPDVKAQAPLATILARHQGEMAARDLWQRFGGEIDAFYAQLKTEVARGWIAEPEPAQVREKPTAEAAKA